MVPPILPSTLRAGTLDLPDLPPLAQYLFGLFYRPILAWFSALVYRLVLTRCAHHITSAVDLEATFRKHEGSPAVLGTNAAISTSATRIRAAVALTGSTPDSEAPCAVLRQELAAGDSVPAVLLMDQAAGHGKTRAQVDALSQGQTTLVALIPQAGGADLSRFRPVDFRISEDGQSCTCPNGVTSTRRYQHGDTEGVFFRFPASQCRGCPLWSDCRDAESKPNAHRTVYLSDYHLYLRDAARFNKTDVGKALLKSRWSFCMGELVAARAHFEQIAALYNVEQHRPLMFQYGQDPGPTGLSVGALDLWLLGYAEQARRWNERAILLAREAAHPYTLVSTLGSSFWLHSSCQEPADAQEQAEEVMAIASKQGLAVALAWGTIFRGWALAKQRQGAAGMAQLRQGVAAYQAAGQQTLVTHHLTLLAEAYQMVGQPAAGLAALDEALALVKTIGERFWEAEIYRLKGELLLTLEGAGLSRGAVEGMQGAESPEGCFLKAMAAATIC
jgi:hypothetical protein